MTGVLQDGCFDQGDDMSGHESSINPPPSSASPSLCSMGRLKILSVSWVG